MKSVFTFINNDFKPSEEALIHISDLGLQRGYGIFDFLKVLNGKPIFLKDHIGRFYHSASVMRLDAGMKPDELEKLIHQLLQKNDIPESGVRITLTGGYAADGYSIATPNLIITQQALQLKQSMNGPAIKLITHAHQRQLPEVKSTDYLMAVWLRELVKQKDADEVLYHQQGKITECPRANIFIVHNGTLITPASNILKGIIRAKVLAIAEGIIPVEERNPELNELFSADEVFITSTTKNILPVSHIDGVLIADGMPGKVTLQLKERLNELITNY